MRPSTQTTLHRHYNSTPPVRIIILIATNLTIMKYKFSIETKKDAQTTNKHTNPTTLLTAALFLYLLHGTEYGDKLATELAAFIFQH